jgi:hypothetical protein
LRRLAYAFVEKEEYSKEEKTFRQNWKIAQVSQFVLVPFYRMSAVPLTRLT